MLEGSTLTDGPLPRCIENHLKKKSDSPSTSPDTHSFKNRPFAGIHSQGSGVLLCGGVAGRKATGKTAVGEGFRRGGGDDSRRKPGRKERPKTP